MPAFQFETNLPVILLIIVIALVSLYFYLELKKVKLVNEELEKKNENLGYENFDPKTYNMVILKDLELIEEQILS